MSERIRGSYDDALYKSTYTLLYFTLQKTCTLQIKKNTVNYYDNMNNTLLAPHHTCKYQIEWKHC